LVSLIQNGQVRAKLEYFIKLLCSPLYCSNSNYVLTFSKTKLCLNVHSFWHTLIATLFLLDIHLKLSTVQLHYMVRENDFDWHNSFLTYLLCEYRFLPFQSTHLQLCSETWSHVYRYMMRVCYPLIGYFQRALHYHSPCLLFDMFNAFFKTPLWRSVTYIKSIHKDIGQMLPCSYTGQRSDHSFWFV
jgi:hypothetical protein